MAGPPIGLQAVLDNTAFQTGLRQYLAGIDQMNKATGRTQSVLDRSYTGMGSTVKGFGGALSNMLTVAGGILSAQIFSRIGSEIASMAREAVTAAGSFQTLQIQFEGLLARDISRQFGTPVADALKTVGDEAQDLLKWVQRVATTTPFSIQSLSTTLAMANAFGFSTDQSKALTISIGNFTAGMGLSNVAMERIIYNFGQMISQGKVTGREMRDLANSMVPVNDILREMADQAGITFEEMRQRVSDGSASATQFIQTFAQMANRDFAGAMQRMSQTLQGVTSNLKDFIGVGIGVGLLGPTIQRFTDAASNALNNLLRPEVMKNFELVGYALGQMFRNVGMAISQNLLPALSALWNAFGLGTPTANTLGVAIIKLSRTFAKIIEAGSQVILFIARFVQEIRDRYGGGLAAIARSAAQWGANIVNALARGMAAAVKSVVNVIKAIGRIISNWLQANSPPKLLPDLPKWGAAAMNSYLQGFAAADFSIFDDIAGVVTDYLQSLGDRIPETDLIPRILGSRSAIARAIALVRETGEITEDVTGRIFRAMGYANDAIKAYIVSLFEMEAASRKVAQAQEALENAQNILRGAQDQLNAVSSISVDNLEDLGRVMDKIGPSLAFQVGQYVNSLRAWKTASEETARAQEELDRVTAVYDERLAGLNAQLQKIVDKQTAMREMEEIAAIEEELADVTLDRAEKEQLLLRLQEIRLRQSIRNTERERDATVESAEDQVAAREAAEEAARMAAEEQRQAVLAAAQSQIDAAQATVDAAEKQLAAIEAQAAAIQQQIEAQRALIEIQTENNELVRDQIELLKQLAKESATAGGGGGAGALGGEDLGLDIGDLGLGDAEAEAKKAGEDLELAMTAPFERAFNTVTGWLDQMEAAIRAAVAKLGIPWDTLSQQLNEKWIYIQAIALTAWEVITDIWASITTTLGPAFEELGLLLQNVGINWQALGDIIGAVMAVIGALVLAGIGIIVGVINGLITAVTESASAWQWFIDSITQVVDGVVGVLTGLWDILVGIFTGNMELLSAGWSDFWNGLLNIAVGLIGTILSSITAPLATLLGLFSGFVSGVVNFFKNLYKELVGGSIIPDMMKDIETVISTSIATVIEFISGWVSDIASTILGAAANIASAAGTVFEGVWTTITGILDNIITSISGFLSDAQSTISSFVSSFKSAGSDLINGLKDGITSKASEIVEAAKGVVNDAIAAAKRLLGISSPSKVFQAMGLNVGQAFANALAGTGAEIKNAMTAALGSAIPGALQPQLQTALNLAMTGVRMPGFDTTRAIGAGGSSTTNITNNFNQQINTSAQSEPIARDFAHMRRVVKALT